MATVGFAKHDHSACIKDALAQAEAVCKAEGLRLTPTRRRALEILLAEHRALGAYDLLAVLAEEGLGKAPPVAYRALEFLTDAGFAHKIEGINAYIACAHLGADHTPAFLICTSCKSVAEAETQASTSQIVKVARDAGFRVDRTVIEALGVCPNCQTEPAC